MGRGVAVRLEHIMVEHGTPDGAIRRRQVAESEQIVEQRVIGGAKRRVVVGPPIVDEDADRFERFDAVPPHIWQIKRIAGFERRFARVAPRLGAARVAVEVVDSGPGLSAEAAARLFEPGYRGTHAAQSLGACRGLSTDPRPSRLYDSAVRVCPGRWRG